MRDVTEKNRRRNTIKTESVEVSRKISLPIVRGSNEELTKKRNTAQRRWRILAEALTGSHRSISSKEKKDDVSVRRFTSFNLLRIEPISNAIGDSDSALWFRYSAILENKRFHVEIRRVNKQFTANELIGFNNTGNVCVWPSEECMAYYLLRNREVCRGKTILELGGGMSCLAGLMAAKYCEPRKVTLTDGNVTSVNNVKRIVARNDVLNDPSIECEVVQWSEAARTIRARNSMRSFLTVHPNCLETKKWKHVAKDLTAIDGKRYDVILCADCLFFDETRTDLVETIYGWLSDHGVALVMAPRRGSTFRNFVEAAKKRGFVAREIDRYDGNVWTRHLELLEESQEYCPDLHYPILLELTKQRGTAPG